MARAASERIRILQVVSSAATSGAELHVRTLSKHLHRRGHDVSLVGPPRSEPCVLEMQGIPLVQTSMKGFGWVRSALLVARLARQRKADVIHSHLTRATYFGYVASLLTGKPLVASVHVATHDPIYKRAARHHNRLVAVSNYVRGMLHGRGIPDRFIDTVYNGTDFIELDWSCPRGVHEEFGIPEDRQLIGMVGRVCEDKGHGLMIQAFPEMLKAEPNAHLVFVGRVEPSFQGDIDALVAQPEMRDRVTLTGNRSDVSRLLDAFRFTAMPSSIETFGLAAIEAMARKRPVVAARVGGLPEIVRHQQTGLLIDRSAGELAEAANYLLRNEEEREYMGEMGRRMVEEKFTVHQMVERLEAVYSRAIGGV